jgi:tetratricopeptide (TPR) repeat protein
MGHHLCFWLLPFYLMTHGSVHDRIREITAAIAQYPDSTHLYMERGDLFLQHEDFDSARTDFEVCLRKGLNNARVWLGMSKSVFHLEFSDNALYYVDLALIENPHSPAALEWRGFVLQSKGQWCAAADTYERLIGLEPLASPALFIDASRAWVECEASDAEAKAIQILRDGISRLGRLHALDKELVRVYLQYQRYADALLIQSHIIQQWTVKTKPYYERAEIYLLMGDDDAAREDLHQALIALDQLPAHKSNTHAMKEMRTKLETRLNTIGH